MKKFLAFLALLPCLSLFSLEHGLNLSMFSHNTNMKNNTHAEIDYRLIFDAQNCKIVFNPVYNVNLNNHHNLSYGIGFEKDFGSCEATQYKIGAYLFRDYSYSHGSHHFQLGPCITFDTQILDLTLNAYIPITGAKYTANHVHRPHRHYDGTLVLKLDPIHLGINPSYNKKLDEWGFVGFLLFPTQYGQWKLGAGENSYEGKHVKLSFDFNVFKDQSKKIARHSGIIVKKKALPISFPVNTPDGITFVPSSSQLEENHIHFKEKESWWRIFGLG